MRGVLMKNKKKLIHTIKLLVLVNIGLVILIIVLLFHFINDNNYSNAKMTITKSELMNLYKDKLLSYIKEDDNQLEYTIFDINKDNIPELIIKSGDSEATYEFIFYTYNENNSSYAYDDYVVYAGTSYGGHSSLYETTNKNYLVNLYSHMGSTSGFDLTLENDWIVEKRINEKVDIDDYLKNSKRIELISYKDTSLFENK